MSSFKLVCGLLLVIVIGSGCASADKRLNQGMELELKGQYENAVMRYVQALEKDSGLKEARTRLSKVGALAVTEQYEAAEDRYSRGNPVGAASHLKRVDGVVVRAYSVGVRLDLPENYDQRRSLVFNDACDALIDGGVMAREQGRWEAGLTDFHRARNEFEPTADQRNRSLAEESALLVKWSEDEYNRGHLRSAFAIAEMVQELEWSPEELSARAADNMEFYLNEGEVELIVLPVQVKSGTRHQRGQRYQLANQLETTLQQGPWRQPPAFVLLHSPLAARDLLAHGGILDGEYRPATLALILRLADADYGAYLQLLGMESTEFDVRSRTESAPDRAGQKKTFVREDGQRRLQAEARVVITDPYGNQIADVIVSGAGTAPFSRGVYDGNPGDLNLSRKQVDLFDRFTLEAQEQAALEALVRDLTAHIAGAVYQPTLAQIP